MRTAIRNKRYGGYFTVEATFIMSFVLVFIVLIIYTAFFLYDRCLFSQDSYLLCETESRIKDDRDVASELMGNTAQRFGRKYFAVTSKSVSAGESSNQVSCEGIAGTAHSLFSGSAVMPSLSFTIHFKASARHSDPPHQIRRYRRLTYLASHVIGSD